MRKAAFDGLRGIPHVWTNNLGRLRRMSFFDRCRKGSAASSPPAELSPSEHTPLLVTRCIDQLALLHPEGWRDLEIRAHVENDGMAMLIDSVDVAPLASPESMPAFPDEARASPGSTVPSRSASRSPRSPRTPSTGICTCGDGRRPRTCSSLSDSLTQ